MHWPVIFFNNIINYLAKYQKFCAAVFAFLLWAVGFIDMFIRATIQQIVDAFLSIDTEAFSNVSLSLIEWIGYANAILPLSEFVVLMVAYSTAWLTVIIVRWIKSFVPTIAN